MAYSTKPTFTADSDEQLQRDVYSELKWDPAVTVTDIGVTVKDGVATLTGKVPHYAEKAAAESAARRVRGVMGVADEITVELPLPAERSDAEIAEAALHVLAWHVSVPKNIKVTVENGWITLTGTAEWEVQRGSAVDAVGYLIGVKGVTNLITLNPEVKTADVNKEIETALHRSAQLDAQKIKVEAVDGKVTLTGTVQSWAAHEEAERAAWGAPGVTAVANYLVVNY